MLHESITLERVYALVATNDNRGLCSACGLEVLGITADSIRYDCPRCHQEAVYGWAELLAMLR